MVFIAIRQQLRALREINGLFLGLRDLLRSLAMSDKSIESIKYSLEDIERIFAERVEINPKPAGLKAGIICEWVFTYPNGNKTANVECAFCIDPKNNDYAMGCAVCNGKIKNKLWEICGQYSLITGEKL